MQGAGLRQVDQTAKARAVHPGPTCVALPAKLRGMRRRLIQASIRASLSVRPSVCLRVRACVGIRASMSVHLSASFVRSQPPHDGLHGSLELV